ENRHSLTLTEAGVKLHSLRFGTGRPHLLVDALVLRLGHRRRPDVDTDHCCRLSLGSSCPQYRTIAGQGSIETPMRASRRGPPEASTLGRRAPGSALGPTWAIRVVALTRIRRRIPMGSTQWSVYRSGETGMHRSRSLAWRGWLIMALGIYFAHEGFTVEKYDSAIRQLEAAGAGSPKGRTLHVALESDGSVNVFDIWESQGEFEAFAAPLMPILEGMGVKLGEPMVAQVHNVIKG